MRSFLLLLTLACFPVLSKAQVDSLQRELSKATGEKRFIILKQLIARDTSVKYTTYLSQASEYAQSKNSTIAEIEISSATGDHFFNRQDYSEALNHYRKALLTSSRQKLLQKTITYLEKCGWALEGMTRMDEALTYYKAALSINQKLKLKDNPALLEEIAFIYLDQQKFDDALLYFKNALKEDIQLKDTVAIAADLNNIGMIYVNKAQFDSSTKYYEATLTYYRLRNDKSSIARTLFSIGVNYKEQGLYDLGLEKILTAARYYEEDSNPEMLAFCYNTIGTIHMELGYYERSLSYQFKALNIRRKINDKLGIANSLTNIGNVYKQQKKYKKALDYLLQSLTVKEELGKKLQIAITLDLLGEVYFLTGKNKEAESFYLRSVNLKEEVGDRKGIALTCNKLGDLYMKLKRYADAEHYLEQARSIAGTTGAKDVLLASYETTARLYREENKAAKALEFYDRYYALKDSIFNQQKNTAITEMQVKYETERKEQEILLLGEKQKAQSALMQKQYITIYSLTGGALLLIIIAFVSFKAYRSYKKANAQNKVIISQKQELLEQKQLMMRELHHRVKNNLQLLSGLLSLQRNRVQQTPAQQALQAVDQRLKAMLLIHRELYLDKSHDRVSILDYVRQLSDNLLSAYGFSKDKIDVQLDVEDLMIDAEKALNLGLIINEAVSNSFKHAFGKVERPMIHISLRNVDEGKLLLVIRDNGPGLPVNNPSTASFGISLVEMLSREMKGSLQFSSTNGTCMELKI